MKTALERILIAEADTRISDELVYQILQPVGYPVRVVRTAAAAIQEVPKISPDLLLVDLNLPDLTGKDLLIAMATQGQEYPVIVLSQTHIESEIIQAFRLGASDYLFWPARDTEVIAVVERVLSQVRARRERERLAQQLRTMNTDLQRLVRELSTLFAIGKAVTSITEQHVLRAKIVAGAVDITEADFGWLLLRREKGQGFTLSAQHPLPADTIVTLSWYDEGLSGLVALSGESLEIHGEPFQRFRIARLGQAALVVPIKVKQDVIGILVVLRKTCRPFTSNSTVLLEAVADYAAISLVNARLFQALEERARRPPKNIEAAQAEEMATGQELSVHG